MIRAVPRLRVLMFALLAAILPAAPAAADVFRPAYLEVVETGQETYDVSWRVPALDRQTTLRLAPQFPAGTRELTRAEPGYSGDAAVLRWQIAVPGGLEGKSIGFPGLATARTDVIVRYQSRDGVEQFGRVLAPAPNFTVEAQAGLAAVAATYSWIGIEHIWLGFDHLLFVLGLILIVRGWRALLGTITAFTLAHSITLGLATFDIIRLPAPPVEATIALSILFVALEALQYERGRRGIATRKPWLVAFLFGLLHGLGFAGALAEVGLPAGEVPLALLFFNLGVEIGQVLFVALILATGWLLAKLYAKPRSRSLARMVLIYAIGAIASYWTIERIAAFWA